MTIIYSLSELMLRTSSTTVIKTTTRKMGLSMSDDDSISGGKNRPIVTRDTTLNMDPSKILFCINRRCR